MGLSGLLRDLSGIGDSGACPLSVEGGRGVGAEPALLCASSGEYGKTCEAMVGPSENGGGGGGVGIGLGFERGR